MALPIEIMRAWVAPKQAMARRLAEGVREDRALMYLILACVLIALSQVPRLSSQSGEMADIPFEALISAMIFGWLFVMPLAAYFIAAITRLLARLFGGKGTWSTARLALFWSLLVAAPLWVLNGLLEALNAPTAIMNISGILAVGMFLFVWAASFFQAESVKGNHDV